MKIAATSKLKLGCINKRDDLLREASLHGMPYIESATCINKYLPPCLPVKEVLNFSSLFGRNEYGAVSSPGLCDRQISSAAVQQVRTHVQQAFW